MAYVLRTCAVDLISYNGFQWPESGYVEAPDWNPAPECGNGLHGFLWGEGNGGLADWSHDAKWLVVKVIGDYVDLGGKVKFRAGEVVYCGDRIGATAKIVELGAKGAVIGGTATAGNDGTATAGYRGTATAGYRGTATAGEYGTATAGEYGTATAGNGGTVMVKYRDGRRYRLAIGYVGEEGIEPNVPYQCDATGRLVRAN